MPTCSAAVGVVLVCFTWLTLAESPAHARAGAAAPTRHASRDEPGLTTRLAPPASDDGNAALLGTTTTLGPDPTTATALSLAPTVLGIVGGMVGAFSAGAGRSHAGVLASVIAGGTLFSVGPSLGLYYAGASGRATATMLARLVLTAGAGVGGTFGTILTAFSSPASGVALLSLSGVALLGAIGLAIWDMLDAGRLARKRRAAALASARAAPRLSVVPMVSRDIRSGARSVGAAALVVF